MAKSKQSVKQAAKASAASGTLSQKQVSQMRSAGVQSSAVKKIQASNTKAQQSANPNAKTNAAGKSNQGSSGNNNPLSQSRYGIGAQKAAAQNYSGLVEQGVTDAFNPGKPGSRANITADGFVGGKELGKFARLKDIDASQARKRLASKNAAFTASANKRADSVFSKNNPMLAMMINAGGDNSFIANSLKGTGRGRQLQIFKDSSSYDYSNRIPGDVFKFRPKGGIVERQPVPNTERLNNIFGNPMADTTTKPEETVTKEEIVPVVEPPVEEEKPVPGMMAGGGLGALGANKLMRAKSRLQRLGILGQGTGLLSRGLQYGNALNA